MFSWCRYINMTKYNYISWEKNSNNEINKSQRGPWRIHKERTKSLFKGSPKTKLTHKKTKNKNKNKKQPIYDKCTHMETWKNLNAKSRLIDISIGYFMLLFLTSEVWNIICNSLGSICTTGWQNLNIMRWSELHTILSFLIKRRRLLFTKLKKFL